MPQVSRTVEGGTEFVVTKFAEIPSVQSYLVAFTVSDFTFVESSGEVVHQRVFGRPQSIANDEGALAIEVSGKILTGFENYLGVNFSLPKMDQAAIPDFAAGEITTIVSMEMKIHSESFARCHGKLGPRDLCRAVFAVQSSHSHDT
jgi:aminopeptidase N